MAISNTIQAIDATIQTLGATAPSDGDRQELLAAARKLQAALESPLDTLVSIVMPSHLAAAVMVAIDMGLFTALLGAPATGINAKGLGEKTGGDPLLITRIMRFLVAKEFAKELGEDLYIAAPKTAYFADSSPLIDSMFHMLVLPDRLI